MMIKALIRKGICNQPSISAGGVGLALVMDDETVQPGKSRWVGSSDHEPRVDNKAVWNQKPPSGNVASSKRIAPSMASGKISGK